MTFSSEQTELVKNYLSSQRVLIADNSSSARIGIRYFSLTSLGLVWLRGHLARIVCQG